MGEDVFVVYIEGEKLTGCEIFYQILTTLLASIYVFNIAYPKELVKNLHFHPQCACRTKESAGTSFFGQTYFRCIGLTECPHSLFHTLNYVKVGLSRKDMIFLTVYLEVYINGHTVIFWCPCLFSYAKWTCNCNLSVMFLHSALYRFSVLNQRMVKELFKYLNYNKAFL